MADRAPNPAALLDSVANVHLINRGTEPGERTVIVEDDERTVQVVFHASRELPPHDVESRLALADLLIAARPLALALLRAQSDESGVEHEVQRLAAIVRNERREAGIALPVGLYGRCLDCGRPTGGWDGIEDLRCGLERGCGSKMVCLTTIGAFDLLDNDAKIIRYHDARGATQALAEIQVVNQQLRSRLVERDARIHALEQDRRELHAEQKAHRATQRELEAARAQVAELTARVGALERTRSLIARPGTLPCESFGEGEPIDPFDDEHSYRHDTEDCGVSDDAIDGATATPITPWSS